MPYVVAVIKTDQVYFWSIVQIVRPVFATDGAGAKVWEASYKPFGGIDVTYAVFWIALDIYLDEGCYTGEDFAWSLVGLVNPFHKIKVVAKLASAVGKKADDFIYGYRAVSKAEAEDILKHGFRPNPSGKSMQDKWFSETQEGANKFKENFSDLDQVVKAKIPKDIYNNSYKNANIDGTGPGFCVPCEYLKRLKVD